MKRARLFVAVAAFVLMGSGIYAATDSQSVTLFSHLPSELQTTENGLGELTYYLLYDQPVAPAVFRHNWKVGIEPRGKAAPEIGAVLSASTADVTNQPQAAQLTYYNPQVLGTSDISEDYLNRLILNNLAASVATGWIASGASVAGLQRASDSPRFAAPSISSQHSTAEIADVNKLLTAKELTVTSDAAIAGDLNVVGATALSSLTVSGDTVLQGSLNVTGTITGNLTGSVNPGFTAGSVVFQGASGLSENNSNLFWDNTNNRLGIGTIAPSEKLDVVGNAKVSGTLAVGASNTLFVNPTTNVVSIGSTTSYANTPFSVTGSSSGTVLPLLSLWNNASGVAGAGAALRLQTHTSGNYIVQIASENESGTPFFQNPAMTFSTMNGSSGVAALRERMRISSIGNVGIGTSTPASILHLAADGSIEQLISRASNDSGVAALGFRKSRGTQSNPLIGNTGDGIGQLNFYGYDGSQYVTSASINVQSEGTLAAGIVPGRIRFFTAGSNGTNTERMRLDSNGNLGIGITSPTGKLHIAGNSSASSWTTAGIQLQGAAATYTDTSSAAGATVATRVANSFAQPTFASTNVITVSDAATLYIANAPAAGTNTTITRAHALQVAAGDAVFAGNVGIGTTSPQVALHVNGSVRGNGTGNALVIDTGSGTLSLGAQNSNYAHFNTNSTLGFYFYRDMSIDGGITPVTHQNNSLGSGAREWLNVFASNGRFSSRVGIGTTSPSTALDINSSDLGNGVAGPVITLGRNNNATSTGAGSINFQSKAGTAGYVWQDAAGNLRINTASPSNANDTAGTVIGTQTSTRDTKQDIADYTDYAAALNMINSAPLHTFKYVKDVQGYGANSKLAKVRIGYIADEVPAEFMWGNSIDQVSVNGILMASIKELSNQITALQNQASNFQGSNQINFSSNTPIVLQSQLYLSGDSVGQAKILAGATSVHISFNKPYQYMPIITATPLGIHEAFYGIENVTADGFNIVINNELSEDITFNWHSFAGAEANLTVSDGGQQRITLAVPEATDEMTIPEDDNKRESSEQEVTVNSEPQTDAASSQITAE